MHYREKGFTLIELMIVVAIIAIIAAIAIPSLLRARVAANETSAVGTLRTLATAQAEFRQAAEVDEDDDGVGQYGFLQELAGTVDFRGRAVAAQPPYIARNLAAKDLGGGVVAAQKSGYDFIMYLPGDAGAVLTEVEGGPNPACAADGRDMQELYYVCYAWPQDAGRSGTRAFVISEEGEVWATKMDTVEYEGVTTVPAATAAYTVEAFTTNLGGGADGNTWTPHG